NGGRSSANMVVPRYRTRVGAGGNPPGPYDAMILMFLSYGRAPVLFNKLDYGPQDKWNYYFRDLHHLCRYITRFTERIYKWQIVSLDATMHDWRDAPILFISGRDKFALSAEHMAKLQRYCDLGGMIVAHADLRSREFAESFKQAMVKLYEQRGYEFRTFAPDHPVYSTHFGRGDSLWRQQIPMQGMSDGVRDFILLLPADIAGAWHQNRATTEEDLFRIMFNVRMYAAPTWAELPGRLRPPELTGTPKEVTRTLRLARIKHRGGWNVIPSAWPVMARRLGHYHGLEVKVLPEVDLSKPVDPAEVDMLHLTGFAKFELSAAERANLKDYLAKGGFLWADAAAGRPAFVQCVQDLVQQLAGRPGRRLVTIHPILTAGAGPISKVWRTRWAKQRFGGSKFPLRAIEQNGRLTILYSPLDVTAAMAGHYVWGSVGYRTRTARQLATNLLLWRAAAKSAKPAKDDKP
ncbi:hypothetical protein LCGC14_2142270, partial [marine sediment metagenome]